MSMNLPAQPSARSSVPSTVPSSAPSSGSCDAAWGHAGDACPSCHRAALRLHEAQAASDGLRREVELVACRLRLAMSQLARAEDRAGHRAIAGTIRSVAAGQSNLSVDAALALLGPAEAPPATATAPAPARRLAAREREV